MSVLARIEVESVGEGTISDGEFMSITTDPHATGRTFYGYVSSMENIDKKVAPGNTPVLVHRGAHFRRPHERRFVTIVYSGMGRVTMNANIRSPIPVMGPVYLNENKDSTFISDTLGTLVGYALHAIRPSDDQVTADILLSFSREETNNEPLVFAQGENGLTNVTYVAYYHDLYGQVFAGDYIDSNGHLIDGPDHEVRKVIQFYISQGYLDVTTGGNQTVAAALLELLRNLPSDLRFNAVNIQQYIDPTVLQRARIQEQEIKRGNEVRVVASSEFSNSGLAEDSKVIYGIDRMTIIKSKNNPVEELDAETTNRIGSLLNFSRGDDGNYNAVQKLFIQAYHEDETKPNVSGLIQTKAEATLFDTYTKPVEGTDPAGMRLYVVGRTSVVELVGVSDDGTVKVKDPYTSEIFDVRQEVAFKKEADIPGTTLIALGVGQEFSESDLYESAKTKIVGRIPPLNELLRQRYIHLAHNPGDYDSVPLGAEFDRLAQISATASPVNMSTPTGTSVTSATISFEQGELIGFDGYLAVVKTLDAKEKLINLADVYAYNP